MSCEIFAMAVTRYTISMKITAAERCSRVLRVRSPEFGVWTSMYLVLLSSVYCEPWGPDPRCSVTGDGLYDVGLGFGVWVWDYWPTLYCTCHVLYVPHAYLSHYRISPAVIDTNAVDIPWAQCHGLSFYIGVDSHLSESSAHQFSITRKSASVGKVELPTMNALRSMMTKFKSSPNYENYKERMVYTVLIASCVLSSIPILVPDSYFIKNEHHGADEDEEEEEE